VSQLTESVLAFYDSRSHQITVVDHGGSADPRVPVGCATTGDRCQAEISTCIERCEATRGPHGQELARTSNPPEATMTECEVRCGCRHRDAPRPASDAPGNRPTPTGM